MRKTTLTILLVAAVATSILEGVPVGRGSNIKMLP